MRFSKPSLILIIVSIVFLSGCVFAIKRDNTSSSAGFLRSTDGGITWKKKNDVPTVSGKPATIENLNILDIVIDPQDPEALYLVSAQGGLWYTYNRGDTWNTAGSFPGVILTAIAVDPMSKCTLYASSGARIFKSVDCSRSWTKIYTDSRTATKVGVIEIDPKDPNIVYAGLTSGELLVSTDAGATWHTKYRFNKVIKQLLIDPRNTDIMYVVATDSLFKSVNNAKKWSKIDDALEKFDRAKGIRRMYFDLSEDNTIYIVTRYGILFSRDGGEKWRKLNLITPPKSVTIRDFAINPKNNKELYYTVGNKIHKSTDGGKNWESQEIESASVITRLILNPKNPSILYAGLYFIEQ